MVTGELRLVKSEVKWRRKKGVTFFVSSGRQWLEVIVGDGQRWQQDSELSSWL